MKISKIKKNNSSEPFIIISLDGVSWYPVCDIFSNHGLTSVVDVLAFNLDKPGYISEHISSKTKSLLPIDLQSFEHVLPFQPLSYRDFMLYEKHCIDASRGFVKKYLPHLLPVVNIYEKIFGKPFPKLKPRNRWYSYPIYYLGNHLTFITHGDQIKIPSYTQELDYELELGVILCKHLKNASPEEAEKAIGGFVVFNDFSARDVQIDEINSGFGPMKSKNFANSISNVVVSADEILPIVNDLQVSVFINGENIVKNNMKGMHYSLPEAIAYASWEEQLHPGEFFGSGTVPGCTGIENNHFLISGDSIRLEIKGMLC